MSLQVIPLGKHDWTSWRERLLVPALERRAMRLLRLPSQDARPMGPQPLVLCDLILPCRR
jgi:hypothetical protein